MARRGPKPKPPHLKALAGNPGRRPLQPGATSGRIRRGRPDRPRELDGEAGREWDRVAEVLDEAGVLAGADRGILAAYCLAVADMLAARAEIVANGRWLRVPVQNARGEVLGERVVEHPAVKLLDKASSRVGKLASELGLSPAARNRLEDAEPPSAPVGNRVLDLAARVADNRDRGTPA